MKKIIVIGSCNTDMVIKSERLPVPGETILGGTFLMNPGGKGANQAVAVARLGGKVTFITKIGDDLFGKESVNLYLSEGINTDFTFSDPKNPSGVALITVDAYGENCIVVASGANSSLSIEDIESARAEIETADILLMQLEIPLETVEYAAKLAHKKGIKIILNPAPACYLPTSLLHCLYVITPNKIEAEILSGVKVRDWESAKEAADVINKKGVDIVVITLGAQGALVKYEGKYYEVPAVKVDAIDTTAAGDVFNGALCVGIAEGKGIIEAVEFACKSSALAVIRLGAQASIPYRDQVV